MTTLHWVLVQTVCLAAVLGRKADEVTRWATAIIPLTFTRPQQPGGARLCICEPGRALSIEVRRRSNEKRKN